ncbi:MAG: F0F1 ATP synthase subunit delta [Gammaproteobacteria bacterium]|jgi:F-type H+-transporting ATPase subunit delta
MAQEASTIARPYAEAIFDRAKETGTLEQWSGALAFIATVVQDATMKTLVSNPNLTDARLTELMLDIVGDQLPDEGGNLVRLLVENDRLGVVPQIAEQFEQLKSREQGKLDVLVTTAFPLSAAQSAAIAQALKAKLGRDINISSVEDPELIGGMHIRAGDLVIDGSVQGQLTKLANELGI